MKAPSRPPAILAAILSASAALSAFGWYQAQPARPGQAAEPSAAAMAETFGGVSTFTIPSRDSTLSFTMPTEIAQVMVIGGVGVKKGDILVRGRDEEFRFRRDLQKSMAESDLDIQKAQAAVDQAQVEFEAQEKLKIKRVDSPVEYDRARTVLIARKVELEIARLEHRQQGIQLTVREAELERLTLRAPFDGKVDRVTGDVGEVKKESEPIVRVVSTDPLWMDADTPVEQTLILGLKPGDPAWVLLGQPGEPKVYIGKVVEVGADAAFEAGKRRIRVALPNPGDLPSGLAAWVRFTAPEGEWAKRVVEQDAQKKADAGPAAPAAAGAGS